MRTRIYLAVILLLNLCTSSTTAQEQCLLQEDFYVPSTSAQGGAPVKFYTINSSPLTLTRRGMVHFIGNDESNIDSTLLGVYMRQTSNPTGGIIGRTGIESVCYTMPDNGGDVSCILGLQTGGGSGLSVFKTHQLRKSGDVDYALSPQGAAEIGTSDGSFALLLSGGMSFGGVPTPYGSTVLQVRAGTPVSPKKVHGIGVSPTNNTWDADRWGIYGGVSVINADPINVQWGWKMNGDNLSRSVTAKGNITLTGADGSIPSLIFSRASGSNFSGDVWFYMPGTSNVSSLFRSYTYLSGESEFRMYLTSASGQQFPKSFAFKSNGVIEGAADPSGLTLPATCFIIGSRFLVTQPGSEKTCYCVASNVWKCAVLS